MNIAHQLAISSFDYCYIAICGISIQVVMTLLILGNCPQMALNGMMMWSIIKIHLLQKISGLNLVQRGNLTSL